MQVSALANLIRLGYGTLDALELTKNWVSHQNTYSINAIINRQGLAAEIADIPSPVDGRIFLSAHFGCFPAAILAIGRKSSCRKVCVLVGREQERLVSPLTALAAAQGISVTVIFAGLSGIKQTKRSLASGYPLFVAPDVPWSKDGAITNASEHRLLNGKITANSGLFRLVANLEFDSVDIFSWVEGSSVQFLCSTHTDEAGYFSKLESSIVRQPWQYERLFQLQNYFSPDHATHIAIVWRVGINDYVLNTTDMRVFDVRGQLDTNDQACLTYVRTHMFPQSVDVVRL